MKANTRRKLALLEQKKYHDFLCRVLSQDVYKKYAPKTRDTVRTTSDLPLSKRRNKLLCS